MVVFGEELFWVCGGGYIDVDVCDVCIQVFRYSGMSRRITSNLCISDSRRLNDIQEQGIKVVKK